MPFPDNDLERVLSAAAAGTTGIDSFVAALLEAPIFVAVGDASDSAAALPVLTIDNRAYVSVFTSLEQAQRAGSAAKLAEMPARQLASSLPSHLGFAVNPGGDLGLPLYAETLQQHLHGSTRLTLGTRVRIGEPLVEPAELLSSLASALDGIPSVIEARRCWAQLGDSEPGLVVGVGIDPDSPDTRSAVLRALGDVTGHSPDAFPVSVVFQNDRDDFTTWMQANAEPFYRSVG